MERGKNELINVHKKFEDAIKHRARKSEAIFQIFKTTIDETPAMPAAMAMGAFRDQKVTFQQKYPGKLGEKIQKLRARP